jgi:hypothetical protein
MICTDCAAGDHLPCLTRPPGCTCQHRTFPSLSTPDDPTTTRIQQEGLNARMIISSNYVYDEEHHRHIPVEDHKLREGLF